MQKRKIQCLLFYKHIACSFSVTLLILYSLTSSSTKTLTIRNEYDIIFKGDIMEKRTGKIIIGKSGGTASGNSETYKLSLPSLWIKQLGITADSREVELSFNGENIIVSKKLSPYETALKKKKQGHHIKLFEFYNADTLCTRIYADFTDKTVSAENFTDNYVKTAFGKKALPDWNDFMSFLSERCIPETRDGLREYLEEIGVDEFSPLDIILKTRGRMAEDEQWLSVEDF